MAVAVDLGDRAARAHARRPFAGHEARAGAAAAGLGDEEVPARAEREVAGRVEVAGDDVDPRGRRGSRGRERRGDGQQDWDEQLLKHAWARPSGGEQRLRAKCQTSSASAGRWQCRGARPQQPADRSRADAHPSGEDGGKPDEPAAHADELHDAHRDRE
jgi:hypothetical protein